MSFFLKYMWSAKISTFIEGMYKTTNGKKIEKKWKLSWQLIRFLFIIYHLIHINVCKTNWKKNKLKLKNNSIFLKSLSNKIRFSCNCIFCFIVIKWEVHHMIYEGEQMYKRLFFFRIIFFFVEIWHSFSNRASTSLFFKWTNKCNALFNKNK